MNIGDMGVPFIYQGEELIYPEYVKDGLVLHYDFSGMTNEDETKGIARDLSGNGNHGTLQNFNFTPESGYDKNKLLFDGVDDKISKTVNTTLGSLEEITLDIVFSLSRLGTYQRLIDMNWSYFSLVVWNDNRLNFNAGGLTTSNSYSVYKVPLDKVLHLTVSYNMNTGMVSFYINGVKDSQVQNSGVLKGNPSDLGIGSMGLGNSQAASGAIYSAKIYNRPLTPEEIAHNYAIEKERFGIE